MSKEQTVPELPAVHIGQRITIDGQRITIDGPELMTPEQAAEVLNLKNPGTLAAWRVREKGPPYFKVEHCVRYLREDLQAWLAAQRVEPGEA